MDWQRYAGLAAAGAGFAAIVGVGALTVASLMPGESPVAVPDRAVLIEGASGPKAFDLRPGEPAVRPPASPPLQEARPPVVAALPEEPAAPRERRSSERPREAVAPPPDPKPAERRPPVVAVPPPDRPPEPVRRAPPVPAPAPQPEGVLTAAEIRRIKLSLRLTREQEPYWLPVEQLLRDIATQQEAMVRAGQNPKDAFGTGAAMRMFSAARPLLDVMREDQKAQVRARAQAMGFGAIASSI